MWPGFSGGENIYGSCRAHEMIQNPRALPSLAVQIKDIRSVWLLLAPSFQGLSPCHPSCSRWHPQVPLPGDTARSQVPVPDVTLRCQVLLAGASPMCHSQVQGATSRCHSQVPGATLRSQVLLPGATSGSQVPVPGPTPRSQVSGATSRCQVPLPDARCHSQCHSQFHSQCHSQCHSQMPLPGPSRCCCCSSRWAQGVFWAPWAAALQSKVPSSCASTSPSPLCVM